MSCRQVTLLVLALAILDGDFDGLDSVPTQESGNAPRSTRGFESCADQNGCLQLDFVGNNYRVGNLYFVGDGAGLAPAEVSIGGTARHCWVRRVRYCPAGIARKGGRK